MFSAVEICYPPIGVAQNPEKDGRFSRRKRCLPCTSEATLFLLSPHCRKQFNPTLNQASPKDGDVERDDWGMRWNQSDCSWGARYSVQESKEGREEDEGEDGVVGRRCRTSAQWEKIPMS